MIINSTDIGGPKNRPDIIGTTNIIQNNKNLFFHKPNITKYNQLVDFKSHL